MCEEKYVFAYKFNLNVKEIKVLTQTLCFSFLDFVKKILFNILNAYLNNHIKQQIFSFFFS